MFTIFIKRLAGRECPARRVLEIPASSRLRRDLGLPEVDFHGRASDHQWNAERGWF